MAGRFVAWFGAWWWIFGLLRYCRVGASLRAVPRPCGREVPASILSRRTGEGVLATGDPGDVL